MLEAGKRGPALKNRLVGDAETHKGLLNRESLRAEDGVKYFKDKMRPHFQGAQSVFLWRVYHFIRVRSGDIEIVKWCCKFSLLLKRLRDAWPDMFPMSATSEQVITYERLFPFSDILTTLMFVVASDVSEAQRERLTSSLSPGSECHCLHNGSSRDSIC